MGSNKSSFLKKFFIKICRKLGYEIIDQNNFKIVTSNKKINDELKKQNDALRAEVNDLKKGTDAIEERAREELGMIKEGETYFQVINKAKQ